MPPSIPDKSAKTVASAIIWEVFCRGGIPESFFTDRGCEFDNQALSTIAQELSIDKKSISALHPQANGTVERINCTTEMLRKTTNQCGDDWDLEIPYVQFHYMNHDHSGLLAILPVSPAWAGRERPCFLVKGDSLPQNSLK